MVIKARKAIMNGNPEAHTPHSLATETSRPNWICLRQRDFSPPRHLSSSITWCKTDRSLVWYHILSGSASWGKILINSCFIPVPNLDTWNYWYWYTHPLHQSHRHQTFVLFRLTTKPYALLIDEWNPRQYLLLAKGWDLWWSYRKWKTMHSTHIVM